MEGRKPTGTLRRGWTTGACAAAAAAAAYRALLTGRFPDAQSIRLPKGEIPTFQLERRDMADGVATASVIKDAGDDPDVTHGAEIVVSVRRNGGGLSFKAGPGVGTVTLPGLPLAVGEPAINPGPRAIIAAAVGAVAEELDGDGAIEITISVPNGEALAAKTMNPRLGIKGGISILGTTGVVVPFSCASWIHSIHRGVDVARAQGIGHLIAATGSTSEAAARTRYSGISEQALIDMGDFAGGLLKYLRRNPVPRLTLAGGFAKLTKLQQGALDLHSSRSEVDMARLAATAGEAGAGAETADAIGAANTAMQALTLAQDAGVPLADAVAKGARETALASLAGGTDVEVLIFDRAGKEVGHAPFAT